MSFNKRIYNFPKIKESYDTGGIEAVKKLFEKTDALIFEDKKSSEVYKHISNNNDNKAIKILK